MKIYAFKRLGEWSFVTEETNIPSDSDDSFYCTITDLSEDETKYFSSHCLIFDDIERTVKFDHNKFDKDIRNVAFIDYNSDFGKNNKWFNDRVKSYPSIGDQLDMIYKDKINGTSIWQTSISNAKSSTPKILP